MFINRDGQTPEQKFKDLEKSLGVENLGGTEIGTSYPEATDQTNFSVVDDGGTLYLVITAKGIRGKIAFTSF